MRGLLLINVTVISLIRVYSDARSGSIVDDRIRPALDSGSAVGSTKPVLLIIDEIDGATGVGDNVRVLQSSSRSKIFILTYFIVEQFYSQTCSTYV